LILPSIPEEGLNATVIAQLALLVATTGYAVASVITRRAPDVAARSFGAMVLLIAAIISTPMAILTVLAEGPRMGTDTYAAILYLGIVPTGISTIFIIHMIRSAGASFLAVGNYATPGAAILFGIILFGEQLTIWHVVGLATILSGVFVAQPGPLISLWRHVRVRKTPAQSLRGDR
ncbi:MAG: DMT family transporter, partial [Pseudomonadota bacterium]